MYDYKNSPCLGAPKGRSVVIRDVLRTKDSAACATNVTCKEGAYVPEIFTLPDLIRL